MDSSSIFWNSSVEELKKGFIELKDSYECLLCGRKIEKGIIYKEGETFYEASKYTELHINKVHGSVFDYILNMDKKLTGLTPQQKKLLFLFYLGKSDEEIKNELNVGSVSTIRNHRFLLKEKERQSRLFIVLMELLKQKDKYAPAIIDIHPGATMVDQRYNITEDEFKSAMKKYFPEGRAKALNAFPKKQKHKLMVLKNIAERFDSEKIYNEKEVNEILKTAFDDYVTLRRYLIEYGFLDRKPDGSQYWIR